MPAFERASPAGAVRPTAGAAVRTLWGWAALAVGSLAIAGVFALLLAVSRIPGIETVFPWPVDFFHKGLVIHVVFSFVVWFLAVFGAMLLMGVEPRPGETENVFRMGATAVVAAAAALPLLFVPALMDRGAATLNDYVPAIVDPVYYAGLVLLASALAIVSIRTLVAIVAGWVHRDVTAIVIAGAAVVYLLALACFGIALLLLVLGDEPPGHTFNEDLFWGGGHVLQFLNTLLLLVAWTWLAEIGLGRPLVPPSVLIAATVLLVLPALAAPVFYLVFAPFSAAQTQAFTDLQYALALPPVLVVGAIVAGTVGQDGRPLPWRDPALLCLAASVVVFAVGGGLGLFVDGADTRTPAHYHGVIAGVTLAFMGLFYALFLPALGRAVRHGKSVYAQIWLFAGGQLTACIGLFLAGGMGAPRKTAGAAQGLDHIGAMVGMGMNGIGGLVAVIGGVLFVWIAATALLRRPSEASVTPIGYRA